MEKQKYFTKTNHSNDFCFSGINSLQTRCFFENDMNNKLHWLGPVAIGGGGGSGTRLVAEILIRLGFYMGNALNTANDNLWFTLLFKRPKWFVNNAKKESEIFRGLSIFEKAMSGSFNPHCNEFIFMLRAAFKMSIFGHNYLGAGRGLWPLKQIMVMMRSQNPDPSKYTGWGWKEPNTHIYIPYLSKYFDSLKYIHVIRHGLDMAYSKNQTQLHSWGDFFGVKIPDSPALLPQASLRYWIKSNKRAIALGRELLNKRFLVLNFDELCLNPRQKIRLLIDFLGLDTKYVNIDELERLPQFPKSAERYKNYDLSIFDKSEIEAIRELGFVVDV